MLLVFFCTIKNLNERNYDINRNNSIRLGIITKGDTIQTNKGLLCLLGGHYDTGVFSIKVFVV